MATADEAAAEATAAARLRLIADAKGRPSIARSVASSHGRDRLVVPLAPEDVPGAVLALRRTRRVTDGVRVTALGDLIDAARSLVADTAATGPAMGEVGEMIFGGDDALRGIGAAAGMDAIVSPSRFLIACAVGTSAGVGSSPATCAGIITDADDSVGIGTYTDNDVPQLVGWIDETFTPPIAIAHGTDYRVELELRDQVLTLRVRERMPAITSTSVAVPSATIGDGAIQLGEAHGVGLVGVIAYALVVDGAIADRDLLAHRYWADALTFFVDPDVVDDALLTEAGDFLLTEAGGRLLLE